MAGIRDTLREFFHGSTPADAISKIETNHGRFVGVTVETDAHVLGVVPAFNDEIGVPNVVLLCRSGLRQGFAGRCPTGSSWRRRK